MSPLLAQLLLQRGISAAGHVSAFLNPSFKELLPPDQLPGAADASRRLLEAVRQNRRIVVYGDYDVDGVTAATILWHALRLAGGNVDYYIPSRFDEGFGLNGDALRQLRAEGAELVITVDCGIAALDEGRIAREIGLDLIITDHHTPKETLPDAVAIVHPTACGDSPNPHLSGAGVALKVAWAFLQRLSEGDRVAPEFRDYLLDATAFAALGLVADIVPLVGENRIIATFGLRHLCHTQNPGLQALIEVSGLAGKRKYDDYDVGFMLAPRLNAVGRMGHARLAVELFTHADAARAAQIAAELDAHNRDRKAVEQKILEQAAAMVVERGFNRDSCHGIVLASQNWHPGVIGIVATRLVERFGRPTILISLNGDEGQGSGRSVRHFPLNEVLTACGEHLLSYGGHAMAAGVRIAADKVEPFTEAFIAQANQRLTPTDLVPKLAIDGEVSLTNLTTDLVDQVERMAPFGLGNARPRLASGPVQLVDRPRTVGQTGQHLQFAVRDESTVRKAIAFRQGDQLAELSDQRAIRVAFEPIINTWNNQRSVELKVIEWQPAD